MFFWQSPAADRWSLSFFLTFHYALTLSLCNVIFYAVCVMQELNTICSWGRGVSEMWCQTLESDFIWAIVSAPRTCGVSMSAAGVSGDPRPWDGNYVCTKKTANEGNRVSEVSERPGKAWIPSSSCWETAVCIFPKLCLWCVYSQTDFKLYLLKSRWLGSGEGSQVLAGSVQGCDLCVHGTSVWLLHVCCKHWAGPAGE